MNLCVKLCECPHKEVIWVILLLKTEGLLWHQNIKQGNTEFGHNRPIHLVHAHQCSQHHYLHLSRCGSNLSNWSVHQLMIKEMWYTHTHTHTQWNTTQLLKRDKNLPFVVAWMDGPGRHYAKRNTVWYYLYVASKEYKKLVNITKKQTQIYKIN